MGFSVAALGANILFVKASAGGTYFCIAATNAGVVTYGKGANVGAVDTLGECNLASW
jgi:hypothetical protein